MPVSLHLRDYCDSLLSSDSVVQEPLPLASELQSRMGVRGRAKQNSSASMRTSFMLSYLKNIMRLVKGSDAQGTLMWDGVPRVSDPLYKMGQKHPGSSAGWSSLAYQASERADEALKVARMHQEAAQNHSLIARACAEQARAAQLQQELTSRTLSHTPQSPKFKKFCSQLKKQIEDSGGPGQESADMAHLQMDCNVGELTDFCTDLKMHLKAHPERMADPEMVKLRRFCGGLEAQLDQSTGEDAPFAASELAKTGYEDGFTLYDNPPELPFKHFPRKMKKGKTLKSGTWKLDEARAKCMETPGCKGFTTSARVFGLIGGAATNDKAGYVELKDSWEDPPLNSGKGDSYKYEGYLSQPPWLDTTRFEAPMRRLWQEGPSCALPAAQALLVLPQPGNFASGERTMPARFQRACRDFL